MNSSDFELGATISVEGRALYPRVDKTLTGRVLGEMPGGLLLVNLGPDFMGHSGLGHELIRGAADGTRNCWFVHTDYVTNVEQGGSITGRFSNPTPHIEEVEKGETVSTKVQTDKVLAHLLAGHTITPLEALGVFQIFRLAARIYDLKKKGHKIVTTNKRDANGKQYAEYSLRNAGRIR